MAKIQEFVKSNWPELPKSTFNSDEVVIVKTVCDSNEGWGHHSYEGIGVTASGDVVWCFSSGCSCSGTCGVEHKPETKILQVDGEDFDLSKIDPAALDFNAMQTSFSDYE